MIDKKQIANDIAIEINNVVYVCNGDKATKYKIFDDKLQTCLLAKANFLGMSNQDLIDLSRYCKEHIHVLNSKIDNTTIKIVGGVLSKTIDKRLQVQFVL